MGPPCQPPPPPPPPSPSPPPPPLPPPPCTRLYGNCFATRCCSDQNAGCYTHFADRQYAQCRPSSTREACPAGWECARLDVAAPPPPSAGGADEVPAYEAWPGSAAPALAWRAALWFEIGLSASVKHSTGWQLIVSWRPPTLRVTPPGARARQPASEAIACAVTRLDIGSHPRDGPFTHTTDCMWRATNRSIGLSLLGQVDDRFSDDVWYPHLHDTEQLVHPRGDLHLQRTWRRRCPRQLRCLQLLFRQHALHRTTFDGRPLAFGVYTTDQEAWEAYVGTSACDPAVLQLPPERCDEGMPREESARSCAHIREHAAAGGGGGHDASMSPAPGEPPPLECGVEGGDCHASRCCKASGERCYAGYLETARCMTECNPGSIWECTELLTPAPHRRASLRAAGAWLTHPAGGLVCAESRLGGESLAATCGARTHAEAVRHCRTRGARVCTLGELRGDVAADSGCSLDGARVWSTDACGVGDGSFWSAGGSAGDSTAAAGHPPRCTDEHTLMPVRCCADEALPPAAPSALPVLVPSRAPSASPSSGAAAWLSAAQQPSAPPPPSPYVAPLDSGRLLPAARAPVWAPLSGAAVAALLACWCLAGQRRAAGAAACGRRGASASRATSSSARQSSKQNVGRYVRADGKAEASACFELEESVDLGAAGAGACAAAVPPGRS